MNIEYKGETAGDGAGYAVAGGGDVDGDGFDDMLIGALYNDDTGSSGSIFNIGGTYLVLGSAGPASTSLSTALQMYGQSYQDYAGAAVAMAGDANGDGYTDMLIGAPYNDDNGTDAGSAYLVLGSAAPRSRDVSGGFDYEGERAGDYAGAALSGAGDVDADGYDDFVIGAYGNDDGPGSDGGAAYLVFGSARPAASDLSTAVEFSAEAAYDYSGWSVGSAGDVDGDGFADFLIGGYGNDDAYSSAGAAYLIFGTGL